MNASGHQRRALITGASEGFGKALCQQLVNEGWHVTGVDWEKSGPATTHVQLDLSQAEALDAFLEGLSAQPPFDLVILNAAVSASGKFEKIPLAAYDRLLQLNTITPMVMAAHLARNRNMNDKSSLVFVSSLSHFTGYPGAAVYAASKDAIAVYARSIRKPFARRGIHVSCVFPGPMRTGQAERHSPRDAKPEKRMEPEIAASLVLRSVLAGKRLIIPGTGPHIFSIAGRIAPSLTAFAMGRIIHDKLDREVY